MADYHPKNVKLKRVAIVLIAVAAVAAAVYLTFGKFGVSERQENLSKEEILKRQLDFLESRRLEVEKNL